MNNENPIDAIAQLYNSAPNVFFGAAVGLIAGFIIAVARAPSPQSQNAQNQPPANLESDTAIHVKTMRDLLFAEMEARTKAEIEKNIIKLDSMKLETQINELRAMLERIQAQANQENKA